MQKELAKLYLGGTEESVESFILSRPSVSRPYLISAAFECLREHAPLNEARDPGALSEDPICRKGRAPIAASKEDRDNDASRLKGREASS